MVCTTYKNGDDCGFMTLFYPHPWEYTIIPSGNHNIATSWKIHGIFIWYEWNMNGNFQPMAVASGNQTWLAGELPHLWTVFPFQRPSTGRFPSLPYLITEGWLWKIWERSEIKAGKWWAFSKKHLRFGIYRPLGKLPYAPPYKDKIFQKS